MPKPIIIKIDSKQLTRKCNDESLITKLKEIGKLDPSSNNTLKICMKKL